MNNKRISYSNILAKECLVSALSILTREKPLSSISISELCAKAGVSRMTFYRNYKAKEDILISHLDEIFEEYKQEDSAGGFYGIYCDEIHLTHYFRYIYHHRDFLDTLIRCGYDVIFLTKLNEYIYKNWKESSDKYQLAAFAGSLYNMFHLWSDSYYSEDSTIFIQKLLSIYCV